MSYRFKEPGHGPDGMRSGDGRMSGGMDGDKMSRDDMDDLGRGPRPPFGRGRRPSPGRDKPFLDRPRDFGGFGRDDMPPGRERDRSPLRGGYDDRYPERDRFKRDDIPYPRRDELGRKDPPRPFLDDREPFREKFMDGRGRFEPPGGFNPRYDMPEDQFKHRPFNYPNVPMKGYYKNDMMKPNECEIIVVNKQQRAYAENIEARMKNLGIQVDILFLKDEALLVQTIDDIARRGSLYAMVISPLNETHGSVTLNILYGTPQEHRNMPLDDALKLVARNFHDHIRSQREIMDRDRSERGFYSGSFPADREIQFLLRLLADGRQVSIGELETVIKYLTDRKDKMKSPQGDQAAPSSSGPPLTANISTSSQKNIKDDIDIAQKEQDLQNRIMNIMNQGPGGDIGNAPPPVGPNKSVGMNIQGDMSGARPSLSPNVGGGQNRPSMGQNQPHMSSIPPGMSPNQPGMNPNQPSGPNQSVNPSQSGIGQNMGNSGPNQPPTSSTYINFDNPSVKKALDSLMQSGPSLLKSLSGANTSTTPVMQDNSPNKTAANLSGMGPQRGGPGGMGDVGNMGPPGGNMGLPQGGMGHPQGRNMGPPDGRNMGPPEGRSMGMPQGHGMNPRQAPNMGPGPMSAMGHRSGSPYQDRQGMFGAASNMMGNRPHYMGMGGPMGNQGMGGPRRY